MVALAAMGYAAVAVAGCTVRPLYSDANPTSGIAAGATAGLGTIAISEVNTRYGQEVRNHLIFLLNGGAGQPASATYTMNLQVSINHQSAALVQVDNEDRPTAGTLRMTASYQLKDIATGQTGITGTRDISASYDQPSQQFAALRARRDAEDRAAREMAELLQLDIGQKLARR